MVTKAAATQANSDRVSRTKPRRMAESVENPTITTTITSTQVTCSSLIRFDSTTPAPIARHATDQPHKVAHIRDSFQFEACAFRFGPVRHHSHTKPQLCGFFEPKLGLRCGADGARKADLAEKHPIARQRLARLRRNQRRSGGDIRRWL